MKRILGILLLFVFASADAALIDRGGGLIYDDIKDITWLQDVNYAQTSGADADGLLDWDSARSWAASLDYFDSVRGVTLSDWRLPETGVPDPTCLDNGFVGNAIPALAIGRDCLGSEMGHMQGFYRVMVESMLGPNQPFINLPVTRNFWSDTEGPTLFDTDGNIIALTSGYTVNFSFEFQQRTDSSLEFYAWAVMDGDVAPVPIPAAAWLFGSALGLLGWMRRARGQFTY